MTRTSDRWQSMPGSFDALHAQQLFRTDNRWGIPCLETTPRSTVPKELFAYKSRRAKPDDLSSIAIHFFLDDYRFEGVWNRPNNALNALAPFSTLLTPDFSLYTDWPLSLQLWNTYRSRWCGAFWQQHGFSVIPTVSWSDEESFAFCFCGIPKRSLVAVSGVGVDFGDPLEYTLFTAGFHAMIQRLAPTLVLAYGKLPTICHRWATIETHPTRWDKIREEQAVKQLFAGDVIVT